MTSSLPKDLRTCIEFFERLPGIGPKTAKRLGFYLLRLPQQDLDMYSESINALKKTSLYCKECFNLTENELCYICDDPSRDRKTIMIVEDVLDLLPFEGGTQYKGLYHVLHGRLDPLNYIGPEDIFIPQLKKRLQQEAINITEIVIATNPNTEGEATALFIKKMIEEEIPELKHVKITRLAYGLPIGAELEYADYMTLKLAMDGRKIL